MSDFYLNPDFLSHPGEENQPFFSKDENILALDLLLQKMEMPAFQHIS